MGHLSTTTTCGIILALFSSGLLITGGETVRIKNLSVPEVVKNGSETSVVLDCDYDLDRNQDGLVVKWFFNNDPQPVYQWIPNRKPQDLGVLKGKLNLDYRASDNENMKYRALQIIKPTTELSGEYKCLVSTYDDEVSETRKMIIYVPERSLELKQVKPTEDRVTISCLAEGVYPEPNMTIRTEPSSLLERVPGVTYETKKTTEDLYDISATITIEDKYFKSETTFECELKIPEAANYTVKKTILYSPDINGSLKNKCQWLFTALSCIFLLLRV